MTVFFKALFSALLEHLTKLLRTDKTGADADATPKELQESDQLVMLHLLLRLQQLQAS